jgi:hypothetical protein
VSCQLPNSVLVLQCKICMFKSLMLVDHHKTSNNNFLKWTPICRVLKKLTIHSGSQEVSHLLWNHKAAYCVHKSLPMITTLNQKNPIHTLQLNSPKIHFWNILPYIHLNLHPQPSTSRSFKWLLSFRHFNKKFVCISHGPMHATGSAHLILLTWSS